MHSFTTWRRVCALVAAVVLPLAAPLAARADGDDSAGASVARISFIQGTVEIQRGDTATPFEAAVNAPVLGADYVTTGPGSRAEIQLDGRSAIRLGEDAQVRLAHLDQDGRELQVAQGTIELRVVGGVEPRTDVDTPSVTLHALVPGSYRISVGNDGRSFLTARSGRAEIVSPQGPRELDPGSTLLAQGPAASPTIESVETVALDGFDAFNRERDARLERALASTQPYVNPNVQGVDDLDAYGRWVPDAQYGEVWVPTNVASDWAPYRDGRWLWEDGYGWTWLGYEPWGWAPYHYGRWYRSAAYGWAWCPPPAGVVEVWRPALVAFFGFGGGFSVGFGNIGWVPLAPFEPFYPWWGRGGTTIVNNVTVINNYGSFTHHYRNALNGGATAISHERFLQGRFDHPVAVTASQAHQFSVAHGALPFAPTTANLRYTGRASTATNVALRPAFQRSFAGTGTVAARVPFETQRSAISAHVMPGAGTNANARAVEQHAAAAQPNPWVRYGAARGTTASPQVIDGSAERGVPTNRMRATTAGNASVNGAATGATGAARSDVWRRFDASTQGRPAVERSTVRSASPAYTERARTDETGVRARGYTAGGAARTYTAGAAARTSTAGASTRAYDTGGARSYETGPRARAYDGAPRGGGGAGSAPAARPGRAAASSRSSGGGQHHGG